MGEPKLQIEAVLTVPPLKVTERRQVRQVMVSDSISANPKAVGGCYQIVLYFTKLTNEEDSGRFLAGWVVESLGMAQSEHPLVAGRLRRGEDGDGGLEIVSNDCGIRIVEARIPLSMSEFLGLNQKDFVDVEGDLAFWKEVDERTPQFSPLFYVQVTRFECGGYSIGISCSLVLADFFMVDNFLKKWADIHKSNIISQNEDSKTITPLFYHPRFKISESPPIDVISRTPTKNEVLNIIFKVTSEDVNFNKDLWKELAMICVEKAEEKFDRSMGESFWLLVKESSEVISVESCCKSGHTSVDRSGLKNEIVCTTWDDFGEYEVAFQRGNKRVLVSRWIGSVSEGHVMAVPYPKEGVSAVIIVSLPVGKTQVEGF